MTHLSNDTYRALADTIIADAEANGWGHGIDEIDLNGMVFSFTDNSRIDKETVYGGSDEYGNCESWTREVVTPMLSDAEVWDNEGNENDTDFDLRSLLNELQGHCTSTMRIR